MELVNKSLIIKIGSGYILEKEIRTESDECDVKFIHYYVLYENMEKMIDQVGYVEYCNVNSSGELEDFKWEWTRMGI